MKMVSWNIEKTALWKEKDTDKEAFDAITRRDDTGMTLLTGIGIWTIWQQRQKEKKAGKKPSGDGSVTLTPELVESCFVDKKEGANSFVVGGLSNEQEKMLRRGMDKLVGAWFF